MTRRKRPSAYASHLPSGEMAPRRVAVANRSELVRGREPLQTHVWRGVRRTRQCEPDDRRAAGNQPEQDDPSAHSGCWMRGAIVPGAMAPGAARRTPSREVSAAGDSSIEKGGDPFEPPPFPTIATRTSEHQRPTPAVVDLTLRREDLLERGHEARHLVLPCRSRRGGAASSAGTGGRRERRFFLNSSITGTTSRPMCTMKKFVCVGIVS